MACITIPGGTLKSPAQTFSPELLEQAINEFPSREPDFTGYLSVAIDDVLYLLFFFNGAPYSAGKSIGEKPFSLSLHDFLREVARIKDPRAILSIHATDPVLLKCLLLFIHDDLIAKAPVSLINLETVVSQIQQQAADALIVLEKEGMFNFFFFKDGIKGKSYFADVSFSDGSDASIDEQLLLYAFQGGGAVIHALIYRTLAAENVVQSEPLTREDVARLLGTDAEKTAMFVAGMTQELVLSIQNGALQGKTVAAAVPCVIGRKEADIVIADPMISKSHAVFQLINGKLSLVDLNSTNGTIVNGGIIKKHEVAVGDLITLGGTIFKVLQLPCR